MTRIEIIKENPRCVASITVRIRKGRANMKIGDKQVKILGIMHRPSGK